MNIWQITLLAFGAVCLNLLLRGVQREIAVLVTVSTAVLLFGQVLLKMSEALRPITDFALSEKYGDTFRVLLKALGVTVMTQTAAEICRTSGEPLIASQVELFGKLEIILLGVPLVIYLLQTAEGILL